MENIKILQFLRRWAKFCTSEVVGEWLPKKFHASKEFSCSFDSYAHLDLILRMILVGKITTRIQQRIHRAIRSLENVLCIKQIKWKQKSFQHCVPITDLHLLDPSSLAFERTLLLCSSSFAINCSCLFKIIPISRHHTLCTPFRFFLLSVVPRSS